jgi:hypothetical protein
MGDCCESLHLGLLLGRAVNTATTRRNGINPHLHDVSIRMQCL